LGAVIRELFTTVLTQIARRLYAVHPNAITVFALVTGILAGFCYWLTTQNTAFFFLGGVLVAISGTADCLDGVVARLYEKTSAMGDFLDHFFDRLVNIAILIGLGLSPNATFSFSLIIGLMVVLNSYLGTQIEASFGKRYYTGLGRAELFIGLIVGSLILGLFPDLSVPVLGRELSLINLFFMLVGISTLTGIVHRYRLAMRLAREESQQSS
jgi:phosphatidylglycerophosphate synthase